MSGCDTVSAFGDVGGKDCIRHLEIHARSTRIFKHFSSTSLEVLDENKTIIEDLV